MTTRIAALGAVALTALLATACSRGADVDASDTNPSSSATAPATAGMDEAAPTGTTAQPPVAPGTTSMNAPSGEQTPPASGRADSYTPGSQSPAPDR